MYRRLAIASLIAMPGCHRPPDAPASAFVTCVMVTRTIVACSAMLEPGSRAGLVCWVATVSCSKGPDRVSGRVCERAVPGIQALHTLDTTDFHEIETCGPLAVTARGVTVSP